MKTRFITASAWLWVAVLPLEIPADNADSAAGRSTRHQTRPAEMHEIHIHSFPAAPGEEREPRTRIRTDRGHTDDMPALPSFRHGHFMPPSARPPGERPRRNWILPPPLDDVEEREESIPSGWGWLADEMAHRRELEDAERLEEEAREESEFWESQFMPEQGEQPPDSLIFEWPLWITDIEQAGTGQDDRVIDVFDMDADLADDDERDVERASFLEMNSFFDPALQEAITRDGGREQDSHDNRWGMDRIWGVSDDMARRPFLSEAPVQSRIPMVPENIPSPFGLPDGPAARGETAATRESVPGEADVSSGDAFQEGWGSPGSFDPGGMVFEYRPFYPESSGISARHTEDTPRTGGSLEERSSFQPVSERTPSIFRNDGWAEDW